ncbi:MAG: ATP-dependent metallopeptidase FtsH/Yme1/Tma family protein [Actinobacteria bacterium]|nr:ATP-dependent metallopeptidase FtsH/Yme1/Tma family protein [Actinomycetota bacterium]
MTKRRRFILIGILAALVVGFLAFRALDLGPSRETLDLTAFEDRLADGEVASVTLFDRDHWIDGELRDGTRYEVHFPEQYTDELTRKIRAAGVRDFDVDGQQQSAWVDLLIRLLPVLLVVGVLFFFLSRSQGGGPGVFGISRSRAKPIGKDQPTVTFSDVAGLDEAVEELQEIKDFLADPERFERMGARIPKGVLLYGPPGTGKTLLAKAVAGEAAVPFFSISGSDFVEMFVGVGASRVRDLFDKAKTAAPAIVFVDEIDAVGRHRGAGLGGGHDEREQTLNQLLVEMDGFDAKAGVILLASTNRPDILDPALLRPGRFDRQIVVDRPDFEGRKKILEVHARNKAITEGVDLEVIARRTTGFTGADLANLMNEAALLAARRDLEHIGLPQLEEAIDRVVAGPERRSRLISPTERRVIAYHESGHALVSHALPDTDPVHKVSIIPRGRALGYTLTLPTEDRFLVRRSELVNELAMLLGGRSAEELIFADPTTGAQNDIERATTIARQMVTEFGMSDILGPMRFGTPKGEVFLGRDFNSMPDYSEKIAADIDAEVRGLIDRAHDAARGILTENRGALDALVEMLMVHETLEADQVIEVLDGVAPWRGAAETGSTRPSAAATSDQTSSRRFRP